jgi:prevent-host-death family protein
MTKTTISEGKKLFTKLISQVSERDSEIVVTKRQLPVAVIISYQHYQKLCRDEAYQTIMSARKLFSKSKLSAEKAYKENRKILTKRP